MILSGAGVGGGSLVYANTLYPPLPPFFQDPQWRHITDWRDELAPAYDQAQRMLGAVVNPTMTPADEVMRAVAEEMGVGDTFHPTPVGVLFGEPGVEVDDPYFGGVGPTRKGCIQCGACMTGCRHGAKNTLLKNYLFLAEQGGAAVHPLTTVDSIQPVAAGGYDVVTSRTGRRRGGGTTRTFHGDHVVLAAGTMGTQRLLHRLRDEGVLPELSPRLGELTRTNSEAILGARTFRGDADYTKGVAITSSFHPTEDTHVEPVRYGKGSNAMGLLTTALADGGGRSRQLTWLRAVARQPVAMFRNLSMRHWSEQTIIALVMQTRDNSITCYTKAGWLGLFGRRLTSKQGHGEPNPTWIPVGPRRGPPHRPPHRRVPRRGLERRVQHPHDGPYPGGRGHRRQPRDRGHRPLSPGVRLPRAAHRRRGPPFLPISASIRRSQSPPRRNGPCRCGPTRASPIRARPWVRRTNGWRR